MEMKNGINQSYARVYNNQLVLAGLRKKEMSGTTIGQEFNLSNASVSSIIKELLEKDIIKVSKSESKANVGRKQVYYTLNDGYGLIAVLSLSDKKSRIVISNIKEKILYDAEKEIAKYDLATIYEIMLEMKKIVETDFGGTPIKSIIISVPGRVDIVSGDLQLSKQFDKSLFEGEENVASLFKKYFGCSVQIKNDIALELFGERANGNLDGVDNALLINIGEGIGSAFLLNGEAYRGENGFAGEIGLFRSNGEYLDEVVSLRALKEKLHLENNKALFDGFNGGSSIKDMVMNSAKALGSLLVDIQEFLNLKKIIITGKVTRFGGEYLDCLRKEMEKAYKPAEIIFSQGGADSVVYGGIYKAVDDLLLEKASSHLD